MKKYLLLVGVAILALLVCQSMAAGALKPSIEKAEVEFSRETKIGDVMVRGKHLLVHDNDAPAGVPCFQIYETINGKATNLVTSFHCLRVERPVSKRFQYISRRLPSGIFQLMEVQFANSMFGHQIPEEIAGR